MEYVHRQHESLSLKMRETVEEEIGYRGVGARG
jgi:hypothetical protein